MFEKPGAFRFDRYTLHNALSKGSIGLPDTSVIYDTTIEILNPYIFCIKVREIKDFKGKACKRKE